MYVYLKNDTKGDLRLQRFAARDWLDDFQTCLHLLIKLNLTHYLGEAPAKNIRRQHNVQADNN